MGTRHHGHSHHSHHEPHWFGDHHHHNGGHEFLFGTRGDNVLEGTDKADVIIGLKGNDELYGRDGNDWLFGDSGKDLLDGGAGSDHVFGGKGNDIAVYSVAENAGVDACGKATHDFYDGGKGGCDVLRLILTPEEMASDAVKADIAAFEAFLADHGGDHGDHGRVFEFTSFDLTVRNFEALEVVGGNTPPDGTDDAYTTLEDVALDIKANPVNKGILSNDTDADGDPLSAVLVTGPSHGALVLNDDGSFTYTPDADYNNDIDGPDGFSYRAFDGTDESAITTVVINVTPVNDAPELDSVDWTTTPNGTISIQVRPGPLTATDEADQTLDVILAPFMTPPENGVVQVVDNTIQYTASDVTGSNTFDYFLIDSAGGFAQGDVNVDVVIV